MFFSIMKKEFRKLYLFWGIVLIFNLTILGYVHSIMKRMFRMDHAEVVWYYTMHIGEVFFSPLMFLPLVSGIFFGVAQFLPEIRNERFRICLHLPVKPHYAVLWHVGAGLTALGAIFILDMVIFYIGVISLFPLEYALRSSLTLLPWILAGFCGYLGATIVLLEPTWRLRIFNFIVSVGVTGFFLQNTNAGAYLHIFPQLLIILMMFIYAVLLPSYNFRYRIA